VFHSLNLGVVRHLDPRNFAFGAGLFVDPGTACRASPSHGARWRSNPTSALQPFKSWARSRFSRQRCGSSDRWRLDRALKHGSHQSLPATRLTSEWMLVLTNRLTVRKCTREPRGVPSESTANATSPFRTADFRFRDRSRWPIEDPVLNAGRRSKRRGGAKAPIPDASGADLRCCDEDPARRRCLISIRCHKVFQPIE